MADNEEKQESVVDGAQGEAPETVPEPEIAEIACLVRLIDGKIEVLTDIEQRFGIKTKNVISLMELPAFLNEASQQMCLCLMQESVRQNVIPIWNEIRGISDALKAHLKGQNVIIPGELEPVAAPAAPVLGDEEPPLIVKP